MFHALSETAYRHMASYPAIVYGLAKSAYGPLAVAWWPSAKGKEMICYLSLQRDVQRVTEQLHRLFPLNAFQRDDKRAKTFAADFALRAKPPAVLLKGTPFFLTVWERLYQTKPGQTLTYGTLAALAERPRASRAVGRAMATNPVALIVPCHRVLASAGTLGGYAYGADVKKRLLAIENACL